MAGKYTYLLINLCTILFPLALSFDKRVQFYKKWPQLWPGMLITGIFFTGWDILFTRQGVWSFNPRYITGLAVFNLPVEEMLFFLTVPYACIFIHACLNYYIKRQIPDWLSKVILILLLIASVYLSVTNYSHLYTLVVFGLLFLVLLLNLLIWGYSWLSRFYFTYLIVLIPFAGVNGLLTALPVVRYNAHEILQLHAGPIPAEDFFYLMALLLMNMGLSEYFTRRRQKLND